LRPLATSRHRARSCDHARVSTYVFGGTPLLFALVVGCGDDPASVADAGADVGEQTESLPRLQLTAEDAPSVAASIWTDNVVTEAADALRGASPIVSDVLPLAAYAVPGVQVEVGCAVSGTTFVVGVIGDPANPGKTAGDTLDVSYVDCDKGVGGLFPEIETGTVSLIVTDVIGDEVRSTFDIDMVTTITGIGEATSVGTQQMAVTTTGATTTVNVAFDRFEVEFDGGDIGGGVFIAEDYNVTLVDGGDEEDASFELSFASTSSNPELGGSYVVETPTSFKGLSNSNPTEGVMLITGANGVQVKLSALEEDSVSIEIDADADGTFELDTASYMTWDQFRRFD
jgi:hypothetical protein